VIQTKTQKTLRSMKNTNTQIVGRIRQLGLAALLATGLTLQAPTPLYQGHTDIGIDYDESVNVWNLHIHDEVTDTEYSPPTNALLVVKYEAHGLVPAGAQWSFLGTAGSDVWTLPNTENTNLLFLGFGAEEIADGTFTNNLFTLTLTGFSGPGNLAIYDLDSFGDPVVWMNTADGVTGADARVLPSGAHSHVNWAFSAPGEYTVTFEANAVSTTNGLTSSGPVDYKFHVVGPPGPQQTWLYQGHTDVGIDYDEEANEWNLHIHDEVNDEEYSPPTNALLVVKNEAHGFVPAGSQWSFLGAAGSDVWTLPKAQDTNLLFLGFGAEEIADGTFTNDQFTIKLTAFSGPGNLAIYDLDSFGDPVVWMNTADGVTGADARVLPSGAHSHVNWAFNAPGDYTVTFEANAVSTTNGLTSSGPVAYQFHVVATNEVLINPNPPQLQIASEGNTVNLAWPTNRGWILQSNSVSLTAANSWFPYPGNGSTGVTNATVEVDPSKANVFFRLMKP
jgi:surface-anchored protein